eukprot:Nk52_evm17s358 gene=Nk52_evmTU17s358
MLDSILNGAGEEEEEGLPPQQRGAESAGSGFSGYGNSGSSNAGGGGVMGGLQACNRSSSGSTHSLSSSSSTIPPRGEAKERERGGEGGAASTTDTGRERESPPPAPGAAQSSSEVQDPLMLLSRAATGGAGGAEVSGCSGGEISGDGKGTMEGVDRESSHRKGSVGGSGVAGGSSDTQPRVMRPGLQQEGREPQQQQQQDLSQGGGFTEDNGKSNSKNKSSGVPNTSSAAAVKPPLTSTSAMRHEYLNHPDGPLLQKFNNVHKNVPSEESPAPPLASEAPNGGTGQARESNIAASGSLEHPNLKSSNSVAPTGAGPTNNTPGKNSTPRGVSCSRSSSISDLCNPPYGSSIHTNSGSMPNVGSGRGGAGATPSSSSSQQQSTPPSARAAVSSGGVGGGHSTNNTNQYYQQLQYTHSQPPQSTYMGFGAGSNAYGTTASSSLPAGSGGYAFCGGHSRSHSQSSIVSNGSVGSNGSSLDGGRLGGSYPQTDNSSLHYFPPHRRTISGGGIGGNLRCHNQPHRQNANNAHKRSNSGETAMSPSNQRNRQEAVRKRSLSLERDTRHASSSPYYRNDLMTSNSVPIMGSGGQAPQHAPVIFPSRKTVLPSGMARGASEHTPSSVTTVVPGEINNNEGNKPLSRTNSQPIHRQSYTTRPWQSSNHPPSSTHQTNMPSPAPPAFKGPALSNNCTPTADNSRAAFQRASSVGQTSEGRGHTPTCGPTMPHPGSQRRSSSPRKTPPPPMSIPYSDTRHVPYSYNSDHPGSTDYRKQRLKSCSPDVAKIIVNVTVEESIDEHFRKSLKNLSFNSHKRGKSPKRVSPQSTRKSVGPTHRPTMVSEDYSRKSQGPSDDRYRRSPQPNTSPQLCRNIKSDPVTSLAGPLFFPQTKIGYEGNASYRSVQQQAQPQHDRVQQQQQHQHHHVNQYHNHSTSVNSESGAVRNSSMYNQTPAEYQSPYQQGQGPIVATVNGPEQRNFPNNYSEPTDKHHYGRHYASQSNPQYGQQQYISSGKTGTGQDGSSGMYRHNPPHETEQYYGNQYVQQPQSGMQGGMWEGAMPPPPDPHQLRAPPPAETLLVQHTSTVHHHHQQKP